MQILSLSLKKSQKTVPKSHFEGLYAAELWACTVGTVRVSSPIKTIRLIRGPSPQSCGISFSSYSSWTPCSITWWPLPAQETRPWNQTHTGHKSEWHINPAPNAALTTDQNRQSSGVYWSPPPPGGDYCALLYLQTDDGHGLPFSVVERLFPQQILKRWKMGVYFTKGRFVSGLISEARVRGERRGSVPGWRRSRRLRRRLRPPQTSPSKCSEGEIKDLPACQTSILTIYKLQSKVHMYCWKNAHGSINRRKISH